MRPAGEDGRGLLVRIRRGLLLKDEAMAAGKGESKAAGKGEIRAACKDPNSRVLHSAGSASPRGLRLSHAQGSRAAI